MSSRIGLEKLYDAQEEWEAYDISDEEEAKVSGEVKPGAWVKIYWQGESLKGVYDIGYLFSLPICNPDDWDLFVHVKNPANPEGRGDAAEEFVHFISLLANKYVKKISIQS